MPRKVTSSNLKAEILEAYNDLYDEHERLEKQCTALREEKETLAEEVATLHVPEADAEEAPAASVDDIVAALSRLRTHFSGAVNTLTAQLTREADELSDLQRQLQNEREQL